MPVSDYNLSASLNVSLAGINIAEGMARGDVNNAIRQLMADIAGDLGSRIAINPAKHGAIGDGTVNDAIALTAASAASVSSGIQIALQPGKNYRITSDVIINGSLFAEPGAKITIPTGVTLSLNGWFHAGVHQVFACEGTGKVIINAAFTQVGYPEWWGCQTNNSAPLAANTAAINAALLALHTTQLQPADYWVNGRLLHATAGHVFAGAGQFYDGATAGRNTRIILTDGSADIVQMGPDVFPGSINALPQGLVIRDLFLIRSVAPVIASACNGLKVKFVLSSMVKNVKSSENIKGFHFTGTVGVQAVDCNAVRSVAGSGAGVDTWDGFYVNGAAVGLGTPGGNASLRLIRPISGCNIAALQTSSSNGVSLDGAFTDTFIDGAESTYCFVGISVVGNGTAGASYGNTNLRISNTVMDQFHKWGIYINNLAAAASLEITNPYLGAASDAQFAIFVNGSGGSVNVIGGQLVMGSGASVQAVAILNSGGVSLRDTVILESGTTAVGLDGASNCRIEPIVQNAGVTGGTAVKLQNTCAANYIAPRVRGKASGSAKGIEVVGTADARNEYNLTGIDSAVIAGGSANKLLRNAVQIIATGLSGTNLVSGVVS